MKAYLHDISFSMDGNTLLTISTAEDCRGLWDDLHDKKVEVNIKRFTKKRSLDANAYAWVLMDKLSAAVGQKKMDVYRDAVRNVGGNTDVICVQDDAVEKLCEAWAKNGSGWITECVPSKISGCTNVILYYGSSTFNTGQMSRLIDNLVQDCKAVGVETMPPDKLEGLLSEWR